MDGTDSTDAQLLSVARQQRKYWITMATVHVNQLATLRDFVTRDGLNYAYTKVRVMYRCYRKTGEDLSTLAQTCVQHTGVAVG